MSERKPARNTSSGRKASTAEPGRPDIRTRFQPGRPGNRKGRPKGARGRKQILQGIALETHTLVEEGRRRTRTTLELVLLSLRNRALGGNVRAFRAAHELLQRYAPQLATKEGGFLIVPATMTPEEWAPFAAEQQRQARGEPDPDSGSPPM